MTLTNFPPPGKYKVLIRCNTYNQSKYIEDALKGFSIQETDFPYLTYVIDDASTDGEPEILKKWISEHCNTCDVVAYDNDIAEILMAKDKDNNNCTYAIHLLKKNLFGTPEKGIIHDYWRVQCEYEAICEGDDYWIDPTKLKLQASFLDDNPDYGLVHTDYMMSRGHRNRTGIIEYKNGIAFPDILIRGYTISTFTSMVRLEVFNKLPKYYNEKKWLMGDKPLWIEIAYFTKIHYIHRITGCYRVLDNSASHSQDIKKLIAFKDSGVDIVKYYYDVFRVSEPIDFYPVSYFEDIIRYACRLGNKRYANLYFKEALSQKKISIRLIFFFYATKYPIIKKLTESLLKFYI